MTNLIYLIVSGLGFVLFGWFIRHPQKIISIGKTPQSQYILYAFIGLGFGVVAAGMVMAVVANNSSYNDLHNMAPLLQLLMLSTATVGAVLGALVAYLHPATLTVTPELQAGIDKLAQAQEDAKKMPREKSALIQGLILTVLSSIILLLNYFFDIFSNMQDQNTGVEQIPTLPVWLLYAAFYMCLIVGIYNILYFLFVKVKHIFASNTSQIQNRER